MRIGVPRETLPGEARVALVPDGVRRLAKAGHTIVVERGAGTASGYSDAQFQDAGATLGTAAEAFGCELVAKVRRPAAEEVGHIKSGGAVVALLQPGATSELFQLFGERGVTGFSLELVPRITRAQSMDVLSSQATVAGYKAVLLGASQLSKLLPMLTTAAGTLAPAKAFIIGAGVAGLQAIATARRLGAVVSAFDVRAAVREQVQSLGASFVAAELVSAAAETKGGYAREQSQDEAQRTLDAIGKHIKDQDLVVTTAQIPGRPAPRLITREMVASMRPGSVIVDVAIESGGNCELARPGETVQEHGVFILGTLNLPSSVALHASQMFSKNVETFINHLAAKDGAMNIDLNDEITGAMCVAHGGQVLFGRKSA